MPPKGPNTKKESGRAKKAENEATKKAVASTEKEKKVAEDWDVGAKSNKAKEEKEEKRKADAARKAEIARLLAEEEASISAKPKPAKAAASKSGSKAKPAAADASSPKGKEKEKDIPTSLSDGEHEKEEPESFAASNLDDALELLSIVTAKTDKASVGAQAAQIEVHPERRFKAAYEAYLERELPKAKEERPGLRLQQYKDLIFKQFQKAPENPFNQTTINYDASKEEKVAALKKQKEMTAERLKEKK